MSSEEDLTPYQRIKTANAERFARLDTIGHAELTRRQNEAQAIVVKLRRGWAEEQREVRARWEERLADPTRDAERARADLSFYENTLTAIAKEAAAERWAVGEATWRATQGKGR
jgi:hypothetical protein